MTKMTFTTKVVLDKLPKKDVNIVMGDANAKIGSDNIGYEDIMGKHGLGTMNNNRERLADMCAFNRLVIGGSIFPPQEDTQNNLGFTRWVDRKPDRSLLRF